MLRGRRHPDRVSNGQPPRRRKGGWLNASAFDLILNGLVALTLSLILWYLSNSFLAWLVLFAPGAALVILGWYKALHE